MRLLHRNSDRKLLLTEDFHQDDVPRYAILSHTWGRNEITFTDLQGDVELESDGGKKVLFCGNQAERDRLQYFWVDTCCIDKSSSAELNEAINSMFLWYQRATKCYVYLSDVSMTVSDVTPNASGRSWELDFRSSKWFRRGWTLQELLAPLTVEFFSKEGYYLGNKTTLSRQICDVTGIPLNALRNSPLSGFTVTERLKWQEHRETTRPEDKAYSLLGIFGIHMPLIYGEREDGAFRRLREEIDRATRGMLPPGFNHANVNMLLIRQAANMMTSLLLSASLAHLQFSLGTLLQERRSSKRCTQY
jgi:hypothetical protein